MNKHDRNNRLQEATDVFLTQRSLSKYYFIHHFYYVGKEQATPSQYFDQSEHRINILTNQNTESIF